MLRHFSCKCQFGVYKLSPDTMNEQGNALNARTIDRPKENNTETNNLQLMANGQTTCGQLGDCKLCYVSHGIICIHCILAAMI